MRYSDVMRVPFGLKFWRKTPFEVDSGGIYTVPVAGKYQVKSESYRYRATGKFEVIPNPKHSFWMPWRPKTITREIFEEIKEREIGEIRLYKAGESINLEDFDNKVKPGEDDGSGQ